MTVASLVVGSFGLVCCGSEVTQSRVEDRADRRDPHVPPARALTFPSALLTVLCESAGVGPCSLADVFLDFALVCISLVLLSSRIY